MSGSCDLNMLAVKYTTPGPVSPTHDRPGTDGTDLRGVGGRGWGCDGTHPQERYTDYRKDPDLRGNPDLRS